MQGGAGHRQTLFLPQREVEGADMPEALQVAGLNKPVNARADLYGQLAVQRKFLGHVAQSGPGRTPCRKQVHPGHEALPFRGARQAAQHAEGGGFARPVGTEQAEDTARLHLETDVVRRHEISETFRQPLGPDDGRGGGEGHGRAPGGREGKLF